VVIVNCNVRNCEDYHTEHCQADEIGLRISGYPPHLHCDKFHEAKKEEEEETEYPDEIEMHLDEAEMELDRTEMACETWLAFGHF